MAKAAGNKNGKFKQELLRPTNVKHDPDFLKNKSNIIYKAQYAKFTQNEDLKNLLLYTKNAKLVHFIKGENPEICNELMVIRNTIKDK
jgi:predicted NAD-dependent protein-ADP-ribosyltransferase YbiA (DUF1768 family)